jgi:3-deoxy-7-phosphoheptulonate synthase
MILRLAKGTTEEQLEELRRRIEQLGLRADVSRGLEETVVGVVGDTTRVDPGLFTELDCVEEVIRITRPYKLVSRQYRRCSLQVRLGPVVVGGPRVVVIAGPCSVESREQMVRLARRIKEAGADALRGGAYKPRTSPYAFQGLGREGLEYLREAREATGLPVVTEATGMHQHRLPSGELEEGSPLEAVTEVADALQVGARNMKAYGFLEEIARRTAAAGKPVLLKRGEAATLEEFLLAAEYVALAGNLNILLCLRGIRTFEERKFQRYTSDIAAIPILKRESCLPVIFDPSHATGDRSLVRPLALAAVAAGADGLLIETHENPRQAWSDGQQSVTPEELAEIIRAVREQEALARPQVEATPPRP